jgi:drug/metabolite transporter (DMT)-like permease
MAAVKEITCPMCGFSNPPDRERCHSCGAKVESLAVQHTAEERHARRHQQEEFHWKWALIGAAVQLVLQAVVLAALPAAIHSFDPQGLPGLMVSVPVMFVGGVVLGLISPDKTFVEPAVAAMLAAVPTSLLVSMRTPQGFEPTFLAYIICAVMGIMMALFGAFLGEKVQMAGQNKPA